MLAAYQAPEPLGREMWPNPGTNVKLPYLPSEVEYQPLPSFGSLVTLLSVIPLSTQNI